MPFLSIRNHPIGPQGTLKSTSTTLASHERVILLLTIGIPTLNEERHILQTLESILSQEIAPQLQVEILVVDNASTDRTVELVKNFFSKHKSSFTRTILTVNNSNLGFSSSTDLILRNCKGDYVWILGAHDSLLPNLLSRLSNAILEYEPSHIILNATVFDEFMQLTVNESIYRFKIPLNEQKYIVAEGVDSFFEKIQGPCGAISLNVVKTDSIKNVLTYYLDTHYFGFYQRFCDAALLSRSGTFIYIDAPCVRLLLKFDGWQYIDVDNFGPKQRKTSHTNFYVETDLAKLAVKRYRNFRFIKRNTGIWTEPFGIARLIAKHKFGGMRTTPEILVKSIAAFRSSYWFWLLGFPILLTPARFLRMNHLLVLRKAVHVIRKILRKEIELV